MSKKKDPTKYQPGGNHYKELKGCQPIVLTHNQDFLTASAVKYILRDKGQEELDLEKIVHYCELRKWYDENPTQISVEDFYNLNKEYMDKDKSKILSAILSYDMDKAIKLTKRLIKKKYLQK